MSGYAAGGRRTLQHALLLASPTPRDLVGEHEELSSQVAVECAGQLSGLRNVDPVNAAQVEEPLREGALADSLGTPQHNGGSGLFPRTLD